MGFDAMRNPFYNSQYDPFSSKKYSYNPACNDRAVCMFKKRFGRKK